MCALAASRLGICTATIYYDYQSHEVGRNFHLHNEEAGHATLKASSPQQCKKKVAPASEALLRDAGGDPPWGCRWGSSLGMQVGTIFELASTFSPLPAREPKRASPGPVQPTQRREPFILPVTWAAIEQDRCLHLKICSVSTSYRKPPRIPPDINTSSVLTVYPLGAWLLAHCSVISFSHAGLSS